MAAEVARALGAHFSSQVLAPLSGDELAAVATALLRFYDGGLALVGGVDVLRLHRRGTGSVEKVIQ